MAFTAKVDFFDTDGNKFSIPVTGITDNCLFSLYAYICQNENRLEWSQPRGKGVQIALGAVDVEAQKYGLPRHSRPPLGCACV